MCNTLLFLLFIFFIAAFCEDYENDEAAYMLVSPDQHLQTPRLEDFFWTGSGDGPPAPDSPAEDLPQPSTPLVKTTTVLATVYLDSYPPQAVTDKTSGECVSNCGEPGAPDSLEPEIPEDRRYWLLTVIQGSTPDSLQLKLARLYQKAFLRQQERHLGIIKSLDAPSPRKKHEVHSFVVYKDNNVNEIATQTYNPLKYLEIHSSIASIANVAHSNYEMENKVLLKPSREPKQFESLREFPQANDFNIRATRLSEVDSWVLATPTGVVRKREAVVREEREDEMERLIDLPLEEDNGNETLLFKREIIKPEQQPPVQVHIQNITESSETGSVQIVYVVLVGGRAVPAAVAARDMRLVRDAEVARELGAVVTTKAEPAYLKAAEGLEGDVGAVPRGSELWALAIGATIAVLLLLALLAMLCVAHRRRAKKSASSLMAYRNELMREAEKSRLKQVHEEKDGKLISVVSPSRTRPSSTLLPIYRADSASGSSTSSGVSEIAVALRRRQKKPHALKMPQKKRVGTTDSLLEAAGVDSSDSQPSIPNTPTSYLSMPSITSFPRSNAVEPLSRILEPVSVRHLDLDSPAQSPAVGVRRQMCSQLVRLGSAGGDPGVIGPRVWDLHCQRVKESSKPSTPAKANLKQSSRMRQRFNELMDDAFTLFGSAASTSQDVADDKERPESRQLTQARNDNVKLPGSPYSALDTVRGKSAEPRSAASVSSAGARPRTSRPADPRAPPARAWGPTPPHSLTAVPTVAPAIILAQPRLARDDPALPLISAIKSEIQRVRENAQKPI